MNFIRRIIKNLDFKKINQWKNALVLVVLLIFCLLDIYPKLWRIAVLSDQIKISRKNMTVLTRADEGKQEQQLKRELSRLTQQIQSLEKGLHDVQGKVKQDTNIDLVTLGVEDLSAASKIELKSLKPQNSLPADHYEILPIAIGFKSEYAQLVNFLEKIENSTNPMSVQTVSIQSDQGIYPQMDTSLNLYVLLTAKPVSDATRPPETEKGTTR